MLGELYCVCVCVVNVCARLRPVPLLVQLNLPQLKGPDSVMSHRSSAILLQKTHKADRKLQTEILRAAAETHVRP